MLTSTRVRPQWEPMHRWSGRGRGWMRRKWYRCNRWRMRRRKENARARIARRTSLVSLSSSTGHTPNSTNRGSSQHGVGRRSTMRAGALVVVGGRDVEIRGGIVMGLTCTCYRSSSYCSRAPGRVRGRTFLQATRQTAQRDWPRNNG